MDIRKGAESYGEAMFDYSKAAGIRFRKRGLAQHTVMSKAALAGKALAPVRRRDGRFAGDRARLNDKNRCSAQEKHSIEMIRRPKR